MASSGLPMVKPMARPGFGTVGQRIRLNANHFPVRLNANVDVFHYTVNFYPTERPPQDLNEEGATTSPPAFNRMVFATFCKVVTTIQCRERVSKFYAVEDASIGLTRGNFCRDRCSIPRTTPRLCVLLFLFSLTTQTYESRFGGALLAYDGRRSAYSATYIPLKDETFQFVIEDEKNRKEDITLMISMVSQKKVGDLITASETAGVELPSDVFQALDIALRDTLVKMYVSVGKSLFSSKDAQPLGEGCSAWRGFYHSLRPTLGGFSLNVEQKFTAFYDEQNLIEFSKQVLNVGEGRQLPKQLQDRDRKLIVKALKGIKVCSRHSGRKINHVIFDLSRVGANKIVFDNDKAQRSMSVAEYFEEAYNLKLEFPGLPCAKVHKKRDIFMPLEVLFVVAQKRVKALTPKQTQKIVRVAATKPQERKRAIIDAVRNAQLDQDKLVSTFGMTVSAEPVSLEGRILTVPSILYSGNRRVEAANGSWNMRNEKLFQSCPPLKSWGVLMFVTSRDVNDGAMNSFIGKLVRVGRENGVNIQNARPLIKRANPNQAENEMKRMKEDLDAQFGPAQMIMCIKFNQDTSLYNAIKRTSDCILGIPSQCALAKHIQKGDMQYCSNLCLKINAKLGGKNAFAEPYRNRELNHKFEGAPFMVVGADVTHPSPGASGMPSIAAMVGSVDREMGKYASSLRNQGGRKEIIEDVKAMFTELVVDFQKQNKGVRPHRIIFYRDGVSEGQFQQVLDWELWELRKACMAMDNNYRPPMTIVTVQKRHNTRFFPEQRAADRNGNAKPGTIVDKGLGHPKFYDFFLCSHGGLQGTSKPALYTVLLDENKFTPDQIQHLTYRLCYNYARCCKSVSIVPSAYYAHHLAFRGRCFIDEGDSDQDSISSSGMQGVAFNQSSTTMVNAQLSTTLYYI